MKKLLASLEEAMEFFVSCAPEKESTRLAKFLASILPENFIVSILPVHLQKSPLARQCYVFHAAEYMENYCEYNAFVVPVEPEEAGMEPTLYAVGIRDGKSVAIHFCPSMLFAYDPDDRWYEKSLTPADGIGPIDLTDFAEMGARHVPIIRKIPPTWTYEEAALHDYLRRLDSSSVYYMRGTAFNLFQSSCAMDYDGANGMSLFLKFVALMDSFDLFDLFIYILADVKPHDEPEEIIHTPDLSF